MMMNCSMKSDSDAIQNMSKMQYKTCLRCNTKHDSDAIQNMTKMQYETWLNTLVHCKAFRHMRTRPCCPEYVQFVTAPGRGWWRAAAARWAWAWWWRAGTAGRRAATWRRSVHASLVAHRHAYASVMHMHAGRVTTWLSWHVDLSHTYTHKYSCAAFACTCLHTYIHTYTLDMYSGYIHTYINMPHVLRRFANPGTTFVGKNNTRAINHMSLIYNCITHLWL
jgi:hypothetical protein